MLFGLHVYRRWWVTLLYVPHRIYECKDQVNSGRFNSQLIAKRRLLSLRPNKHRSHYFKDRLIQIHYLIAGKQKAIYVRAPFHLLLRREGAKGNVCGCTPQLDECQAFEWQLHRGMPRRDDRVLICLSLSSLMSLSLPSKWNLPLLSTPALVRSRERAEDIFKRASKTS